MTCTARRLFIFTVAAAGLASAAPRAFAQARWPFWGGDLHNRHFAAGETAIAPSTVARLAPKWIFPTLGDVFAIPTVQDGRLYLLDAGLPLLPGWPGGRLRALDAASGWELWSRSITDFNGDLVRNLSRTSPAVAGNLLVIGDNRNEPLTLFDVGTSGSSIYAIDRTSGALQWKTEIDPHPLSVVTQSPVVYQGRVYVGVSSLEEAAARLSYPCCTFRGSMVALDLASGRILWKTYLLPDNFGQPFGYAGAAVWGSSPAIDEKRNAVYIATGNAYRFPDALASCLTIYSGDPQAQQDHCYTPLDAPDDYAFSVLALDLDTGAIHWAQKLQNWGAWTLACDPQFAPWLPANDKNCQNLDGLDFDFGQAPLLYTTPGGRDLVAVGQKSGTFWAFDPDAGGAIAWATPVGPGGTFGGMEFGAATDGTRIYTSLTNFKHKPFTLSAGAQAGTRVNGGIWAALDAATGALLWQTPDPSSFRPMSGLLVQPYWGAGLGPGFFGVAMGPVTVANGLVFAGSMDPEGHMYALEAATGQVRWSFASGGSVMTAPAIVDGVVYWGSGYDRGFNNNRFYAFALPR
jgi:polyvinyl alcohol dehydrogenase (cytochrome)